jgi:hypothetical protein
MSTGYVDPITDGMLVYLDNRSVHFGPWEVMRGSLAASGRSRPRSIFSLFRAETAEPAHLWLTSPRLMANGVRFPDRVTLSLYEVG